MSIIANSLNQSVTSISSISIDEYNDKTLTTIHSDVRCRWQESIVQSVNNAGEEVISKIQMWVMPEITIAEGYRVVKDAVTYVVVSYEKQYNIMGVHDHTKVYLR